MKIANCQIKLARWQDDIDDIKAIRTEVFIKEQHVPVELEWDGLDEQCSHFIVRTDTKSIATARLKPDGQLGRMAVLKDFRGLGVGTELLTTALTHAKNTGLTQVRLHAQVQVIGFYQRFGFITEGKEFIDAGIPHRAMLINIC